MIEIPFAKVEVADVPVTLRYVVFKPLARVDVAFDKIVEVAVPFWSIESTVVDALPENVCKPVKMFGCVRSRATVTAAVSLPEFATVRPPAFATVAT